MQTNIVHLNYRTVAFGALKAGLLLGDGALRTDLAGHDIALHHRSAAGRSRDEAEATCRDVMAQARAEDGGLQLEEPKAQSLAAAFTVVPVVIMGIYLIIARRLGAFDAL